MSPQVLRSSTRPSSGLVSVDGRAYPLRSAHVEGRAEGGLALTKLVQEFHNPYTEALEVAYTMPLPADGAVLGYTITIGSRVVHGEIEVRETAEARYREALYRGQTAGLLEEDRPDTFHQRLGNIPAGTGVRVEIETLQPLAFLAATPEAAPSWEYRFPTGVGVRYEGQPGRVADAERLDSDRVTDGGIPTRFSLNLTLADETAAYGNVTSSSHEIVSTSSPEGTVVQFGAGVRLDRDVVVRWTAATSAVGLRVVEGRGLAGDDGRYALLTLTPPAAAGRAHARDLTVLIDSSGSMSGEPLTLAKTVVEALLRGLEEGDRFEILSFSNQVQRLTRGMTAATPAAVERAIHDVQAIEAGGGTEMEHAVAEALRPLRHDLQRQIVLVTDGQIGFERQVIARVRSIPAGVRIHTVGIGAAPNRSLTAFLARAGRGRELIIQDANTAREAGSRLRAATARPILTEIKVTGPAVVAAAPAKPRDVLAGEPLVVAVELKPRGGRLEVSGKMAGEKKESKWEMALPAAHDAAVKTETPQSSGPAAIRMTPLPLGALYGREAIADLEAAAAAGIDSLEHIDTRIEELGLRHRITSRRTSLVAIFEEATTDPLAPRRRERLALELPAGVSAEGVGLFHEPLASRAASSELTFLMRLPIETGSLAAGRFSRREYLRSGSTEDLSAETGETAVTHTLTGTVIHRDGLELVLEVQAPVDGFVLPTGKALVVSDGDLGVARIVPEKSTPPGPHPAGVVVRLTLRLENRAEWPQEGHMIFASSGHDSGAATSVIKILFSTKKSAPAAPPAS